MTKVQPVKTPPKSDSKQSSKQMYRGIVTAQAIADVFVRATSDVQANQMIKGGKGQRTKPRFGEWELWQEAIAVDTYKASEIPAQEISKTGLTEQELRQIYMNVQHSISINRGSCTDKEREAMADVLREFHDLLTEAIRVKGRRS